MVETYLQSYDEYDNNYYSWSTKFPLSTIIEYASEFTLSRQ